MWVAVKTIFPAVLLTDNILAREREGEQIYGIPQFTGMVIGLTTIVLNISRCGWIPAGDKLSPVEIAGDMDRCNCCTHIDASFLRMLY